MSKLHISVTNEGKTVFESDGDLLMLGVLKGCDCDTLTEGTGNSAMMATLITSLLQHIEETTEGHPQLPPLILLLNQIMHTKEIKEDGTQ